MVRFNWLCALFVVSWCLTAPTTSTVLAADAGNELVEVVVTGVGVNEREAEVEALRAAVQQVAGSIVSGETIVKNEELFRDKVLVYSSGIVKKHDRLGQPAKAAGGLVRVTIRAQVEKRELMQRLQAASIHTAKVDGAGILARWEAQLKNEKDGAKLLAHLFADLPTHALDAHVVGEPRQIAVGAGEVKIGVQVRLSISQERWSAWFKTSRPYLERLATKTSSGRWEAANGRYKPNRFSSINFNNILELTGRDWQGEATQSDNPYDFQQLKVMPERRSAVLGGTDKWGNVSMTRTEIEKSLWCHWTDGWFDGQSHDSAIILVLDRFPAGTVYQFFMEKNVFAGLSEARIGIPSLKVILRDGSGQEVASCEDKAVFSVGDHNLFAATPLWLIIYGAYDRERNQQRMVPLAADAAMSGHALKERADAVHPKLFAAPSLGAVNCSSLLSGFSNEFVFTLTKDEWSRVKKTQAMVVPAAD